MSMLKRPKSIFSIACLFLFLFGFKALLHGFPDIERFFAEWNDERLTLTYIMKFGTLNFAPTQIWHPPLYHYLTFIPIALFYSIGKLIGLFHDKIGFMGLYFDKMHYFFFIGRLMSYVFYWASAIMIYRISRLFFGRTISRLTTLAYLLIPRLILDFSTTRPETLLLFNSAVFFYFIFKHYLNPVKVKYLYFAAFFLGVSIATKYNAVLLGSIFAPILFYRRKDIFKIFLGLCFFSFIGFFVSDPFFIIRFSKYFHNFMVYNEEVKYYWSSPAVFFVTHLKELTSFMYLNPVGFVVLIFGACAMLKKDKKLFCIVFFTAMAYEVYFGIFRNTQSPLRYLNPIFPLFALFFSAGADFLIKKNRKLFYGIIAIFIGILSYNYFEISHNLSYRPTYIQKARAYIENTVPEFTNICVFSNSYIPQLNMTEKSYHHLIETAPKVKAVEGHELNYIEMDDRDKYDDYVTMLRIESLAKKPQYNLIRWDSGIETEAEAVKFLNKLNIKYVISSDPAIINNKKIELTNIASLVKKFEPIDIRVYAPKTVYIYRVNEN